MNTTLTLDEIQAQFDSEWILVADPEFDAESRLTRGRILFHSKSREEVDRKDAELKPSSAAILYTGEIPEGTAVVL